MTAELMDKVKSVKNQIKDLYCLEEMYPWVIGYSGGKDSTLVTQLVFESVSELFAQGIETNRKIYVLTSDTLVENPVIFAHQMANLSAIQTAGEKINISVRHVVPDMTDTYWVNIIGKGYPVPNQSFRWCTSRLKINPISEETEKIAQEFDKVLVLIGSRYGESASRDRLLSKYVDENNTSKHPTLNYALQYSPILFFSLEEVWRYLLEHEAPWGERDNSLNRGLFLLYESSSMDNNDCPWALDIDRKTRSCGSSRWGCWACTVVTKDKSLSIFMQNGYSWVRPLVEFRDQLQYDRNSRNNRYLGGISVRKGIVYLKKHTMKMELINVSGEQCLRLKPQIGREEILLNLSLLRSNDTQYTLIDYDTFLEIPVKNFFTEANLYNTIVEMPNGSYRILGIGAYTLAYRKTLLDKLLQIQSIIGHNLQLISEGEIRIIHEYWETTKKELEGE